MAAAAAKAIMNFTISKSHFNTSLHSIKPDTTTFPSSTSPPIMHPSRERLNSLGWLNTRKPNRVNALPDWPLMAVLVEDFDGRELITTKTIWHLSDQAIKNVYTMYIMFTCWGCLFFGSTKDPYYDSELYRKDGGDGTGHWIYDKQEDMEEAARAELWREELIEEIEQKVGGLRELEEVGRK